MSCSFPTSTGLTALTVLLAAGSGASAGPEPYFGLSHTPLGGAILAPGPSGGLLISNIGSSGNDGVAIGLGGTTGFAIQLDPGEGGSLATGSMVCVTSTSTGGSLPHASMVDDGDGSANFVLDSVGMLTPQCVLVQLRLRDDVIDEKEFPLSAVGTVLVSGPFGSDEFGQPMTFELSSTATDHTIEIFNPEPILASITGSPLGPVGCDEVAIRLNGLPPGEPVMGTLTVLVSNQPGGTLPVLGEYMRIRPKGWDGTIKGHLRTVGGAQMTAIAGPDICAGCPECCDPPGGNPIDLFNGAIISEIGSSGQDGVTYACRTWGSPWFVSDIDLRMSGIVVVDDDTIFLDGVGTFAGMPGHPLGECAIRGDILSGSLELLADFSAVGSSDVLVEVRDNGIPQGSVLLSGGPGVVLGNLYSGGGLPLEWTKCGKLGGIGQTPCYVWGSEKPFIFISGMVALLGDELRVLAVSAAGPISEIQSLTLRGKGLDPFTVTAINDPDVSDDPVYFAGLPHTAIGQAVLVPDDSDGDDVPDLLVTNIGASGQDGVTVDLGQSEGVLFNGRISRFWQDPDNLCLVAFDIYDDQCPTCPGGLVAAIEVTEVSPTENTFAVSRGTLTGNVTLIKLSGEPAGEFTMPMTDMLTITTDPGSELKITSIGAAAMHDALISEVGIPLRCAMVENPPNPVDPGVTVTHSVHGSFFDVGEIVVTTSESGSDIGSIDRACLRAMAHPGTTGSFLLTRTGVVQHGHVHHAIGDVALVSQECDVDGAGPDLISAAMVCCLGSSAENGVEVDLRTHTCNDADSDCDGLPDDKVTGITVLLHETAAPTELPLFRIRGTIDDGPVEELCSFARVCCPSPGHTTLLTAAPAFGGTPTSRHVVVRDQFDNIVTQADAPEPGPVATQSGTDAPSFYSGSFTITITALLTGETETVSFNYQKISWGYDILLELPGQSFVAGRSLEVITGPSSGNPVTTNLDLDDFEILFDAPPGEMMSIGLLEETIELYEPPCPGDLDGNGNIGFSDLTLLLINWGLCDAPPTSCPADIDGSGNVGFGDLTTLLINWGPWIGLECRR